MPGRPPNPNGTKRDNSVHIQGWFEKSHPHDSVVVETFNRLLKSYKNQSVTMKDIVGYGVLALGKENLDNYIEARKTTEAEAIARLSTLLSRLEQSATTISQVADSISSGQFVASTSSADIHRAIKDFNEAKEDLTAEQTNLMSSVANQYRMGATFDFDDEDDE